MRPVRLDRIFFVKLPDELTRSEIFKIKIKQMPVSENLDLDEFDKITERYSGAEITALCNEAAYLALEQDINSTCISQQNFKNSL
jgi:AAA family ATPase